MGFMGFPLISGHFRSFEQGEERVGVWNGGGE